MAKIHDLEISNSWSGNIDKPWMNNSALQWTSVATKQKERKYLSAKVNAGLLLQSGISGNQNWEITKTAWQGFLICNNYIETTSSL